MGDYKLLEFFEDGRLELYNLKDDLGETKNLAASQSDRARRMREKLAAWRESINAKMPIPNPNYDPKKADQLKPRQRGNR